MVVVGVALVLVGAALLEAEAHEPAGVQGWPAGSRSSAARALAIAAAGAVLRSAASGHRGRRRSGLRLAVATRKTLATQTACFSGREALSGHIGVVRNWTGAGGQVFVDGALWRAS